MAAVVNPIAPTNESVAMGAQVYQAHCPICHGDTGRGDGPAAFGMIPRPADFRVHMAAGHADGDLFYWVSEGLRGTAMPAFGELLSEEERWHVINFIRTFAPPE
jgi:putative copper resistance protein D